MLFVRFIDMWNGYFDGLLRPYRVFPDMGSFLNNDQFADLHNILSIVGIFSITLYKYLNPFLIDLIMPDLSGRISIHSVNVRVDTALSEDASLRSNIFGFHDALNISGH